MKDIIWTIIIVWLIYKVVEIFRLGKKQAEINNPERDGKTRIFKTDTNEKPDPSTMHKTLDKEGEYVEFEEVK